MNTWKVTKGHSFSYHQSIVCKRSPTWALRPNQNWRKLTEMFFLPLYLLFVGGYFKGMSFPSSPMKIKRGFERAPAESYKKCIIPFIVFIFTRGGEHLGATSVCNALKFWAQGKLREARGRQRFPSLDALWFAHNKATGHKSSSLDKGEFS